MAQLPIKLYGEPVLRERARPMTREEVDADFRAFVEDMGETMYAAAGIGLAANQVGDLRRVFVIDVDQLKEARRRAKKDPSKRRLQVMINPEVLEASPEDGDYTEGCLSMPDLEGDVWRPLRVKVRYRTLDWEERIEWIDDITARVFQHELDHLDGVLFIDHLPDDVRVRLAGALNKLKRATLESQMATAEKD